MTSTVVPGFVLRQELAAIRSRSAALSVPQDAPPTRHERMALRVRSALATVSARARGGGAAGGAGGRGRGLDGHARS